MTGKRPGFYGQKAEVLLDDAMNKFESRIDLLKEDSGRTGLFSAP